MRQSVETITCDRCKEIISKASETRISLNISGTGTITIDGNTTNIKGKIDFCNIQCLQIYCKRGMSKILIK